MKVLARKAYLSFLRCYNKHPLKKVFNIKKLDLKAAAKAFGFIEQPHVDFCILFNIGTGKFIKYYVNYYI